MNTIPITIKTDPKVKKEAEKTFQQLGFSLSSVLNAFLSQVARTKSVSFSSEDLEEIPNEHTRKLLKQSEEDVKAGRVSPSFSTVKDAVAWLDDPNAVYVNGGKSL